MRIKFLVLISIFAFFPALFIVDQAAGQDSVKKESDSGEFQIYLLKENNKIDLSNTNILDLKLQKIPVVTSKDILSYSVNNHEMILKPSAFSRFMKDPETQFLFVVCVGKERIYVGSVLSDICSASFGGIVILKHPHVLEPLNDRFPDFTEREDWKGLAKTWADEHTIHFSLGYPSPPFFKGKDVRNDPRIIQALEREGKLKEETGLSTD